MTFRYDDLPVRTDAAYNWHCVACQRPFEDLIWPDMLIRRADGIFDPLCIDCAAVLMRHTLTGVQLAEYFEQT